MEEVIFVPAPELDEALADTVQEYTAAVPLPVDAIGYYAYSHATGSCGAVSLNWMA